MSALANLVDCVLCQDGELLDGGTACPNCN